MEAWREDGHLAVGATLAANVGYGLPYGLAGAALSEWPAVAFIGCAEMAIGMVRQANPFPARTSRTGRRATRHGTRAFYPEGIHPAEAAMTVGPWYGTAGVGRRQMRASTIDRDHAVEMITKAYTEGRLTKDEHDARVEQAMTASTYAELDSVVVDLPGARPPAPPAPPAPPKNNALAIASLVCGAAQLMLWPLATIPAVVLGHVARRQIRRTGEQGAGLALAGLILGWIGVGFAVLAVIGIVLAAVSIDVTPG